MGLQAVDQPHLDRLVRVHCPAPQYFGFEGGGRDVLALEFVDAVGQHLQFELISPIPDEFGDELAVFELVELGHCLDLALRVGDSLQPNVVSLIEVVKRVVLIDVAEISQNGEFV